MLRARLRCGGVPVELRHISLSLLRAASHAALPCCGAFPARPSDRECRSLGTGVLGHNKERACVCQGREWYTALVCADFWLARAASGCPAFFAEEPARGRRGGMRRLRCAGCRRCRTSDGGARISAGCGLVRAVSTSGRDWALVPGVAVQHPQAPAKGEVDPTLDLGEQHGCQMLDEGGNHTRWAASSGPRSAVPRHREIDWKLVRSICKQLDIPPPEDGR